MAFLVMLKWFRSNWGFTLKPIQFDIFESATIHYEFMSCKLLWLFLVPFSFEKCSAGLCVCMYVCVCARLCTFVWLRQQWEREKEKNREFLKTLLYYTNSIRIYKYRHHRLIWLDWIGICSVFLEIYTKCRK